jgi:hypothetical protein
MNTLERRLFAKRRVIALAIANEAHNKASIPQIGASASRKKLAKQLAARSAASSQVDSISYPHLRRVS